MHDSLPDLGINNIENECVPQIRLPEHQKLKEYRPELAAKNLPSILGPIGKTFKLSLLGAFFLKLGFDLMQFVSPMLLKLLIKFMEVIVFYGQLMELKLLTVQNPGLGRTVVRNPLRSTPIVYFRLTKVLPKSANNRKLISIREKSPSKFMKEN